MSLISNNTYFSGESGTLAWRRHQGSVLAKIGGLWLLNPARTQRFQNYLMQSSGTAIGVLAMPEG